MFKIRNRKDRFTVLFRDKNKVELQSCFEIVIKTTDTF